MYVTSSASTSRRSSGTTSSERSANGRSENRCQHTRTAPSATAIPRCVSLISLIRLLGWVDVIVCTSRQEIRALPIRQMQTLLTDKKPADIATPLHLTAAPLAPFFMPTSPPCIAVTVEKQEVLLPQQLWGKLTFLHLSFNQFAFDLGRKWCEAANHFAALPLAAPSTDPPTAPLSAPPITQPLSPSPALTPSPSLGLAVDVSPFDYYQISLIKNPFVRHWFGDYSLSSFRSTTPPHMHRHLLSLLSDHSYNTLTAQEPVLQLRPHELMGFVFLLDSRSRIRWRAWGVMTEGDREVLGRMIGELREEDARDRRREGVERVRGKEGLERRATSGVKGGQAYEAGAKVNGSSRVNGGASKAEKAEKPSESARTEKVDTADTGVVSETAAVAKG